MNARQAHTYLNSFINFENNFNALDASSFKLERIRALLKLLGNPDEDVNVIHVAGSKGKGSVCSIVAYILKEAGFKVGLYTSPHLNRVNERIRILGRQEDFDAAGPIFPDEISDQEFADILEDIRPGIEIIRQREDLGRLTYYEVITVLALVYFKKNAVDFVILETGLGGRLDATNAVYSIVAAITSISYEHTQILGETLKQIAKEKAGIIKNPEQKVVVAHQCEEVKHVIEKRCKHFSIRPKAVGYNIHYKRKAQGHDGETFQIRTRRGDYPDFHIPLFGEHQIMNAAVSLGVIESLQECGVAVSVEALARGFKNIFWPGRLEVIPSSPTMVLDAAHNRESAKELVKTVREIFPNKGITLVFGLSSDKNVEEFYSEFKGITERVITTVADHPRARRFTEMELNRLFAGKEYCQTKSVEEAIDLAKKESPSNAIIVVTGSIFVVSEARRICTSIKA